MFGHLSLIWGPEEFLVERQVSRWIADARQTQPEAGLTTTAGIDLSPGLLDQMIQSDLFSTAAIACITGAEQIPKSVEPYLKQLTKQIPDNVALIVCHSGGNRGKSLLDHLKTTATMKVECPTMKVPQLVKLVCDEVRAGGKTISASAAQSLIDAIGQDTRSLVGAVGQLLDDTASDSITVPIVNRYFAGRANITSYAVSDDAIAGRAGEAIIKLRWALSTGVAHVLITAALASSLRQIGLYLSVSRRHQPTAAEIGAPHWKLRDIAASAQAWSENTIGAAIEAVALADAQIKGASQDPDFALEQLIIRLAALRRASNAGS